MLLPFCQCEHLLVSTHHYSAAQGVATAIGKSAHGLQDKALTHKSQLCTFGSSAMLQWRKLHQLMRHRGQRSGRKPASCCPRNRVRA